MKLIRLGAAALNQTPLAWQTNQWHILAAIEAARAEGVAVLCLPELCITGYGCEDMFFSAGVQETALAMLGEIVPATEGIIVSLGLPVVYEGSIYNAAALACDGKLVGIVAKQVLAGDGIHYEPRWFKPWPRGEVGSLDVQGKSYPLGDLLFDCGGLKIGFEICRDAWVEDRPGACLARRGADVILNPSASHFAFAKQEIREGFVLAGSRDFGVGFVYTNLVGNESGRAIYDGGTLIASGGKMLARGPRFSYADWLLTSAEIDVQALRDAKPENLLTPNANEGGKTIKVPFDASLSMVTDSAKSHSKRGIVVSLAENKNGWVSIGLDQGLPGHPEWESGPHVKEEEFARAVPLGLFDYLRKSAARGFVVSLSGGADSSAVAVLIHLMVRLAGAELSPSGLTAKLPRIESDRSTEADWGRWTGRLLTCIYQATQHSGETTRRSAKSVAEAIGARFYEWSVDKMVEDYMATVGRSVGHDWTWENDDAAMQNIQARARGPSAWLLANLNGALLLSTSNRSEAAVGYATMDGDTCGGLAPIAGIDKAFLLDWLQWMETIGPEGVGPLPALAEVNNQIPTAELRPVSASQTDEADLMPYRVLDAIERAAIRDRQMPVEVFDSVRPQFPEHSPQVIGKWVERFFQLWCRNQWKRERYAPSFHLDDENLDPKTWCRFPILNSGFERELEQLREHVNRCSKPLP